MKRMLFQLIIALLLAVALSTVVVKTTKPKKVPAVAPVVKEAPAPKEEKMVEVLISNKVLNIGQKITLKDLNWVTRKEKDLQENLIVKGKHNINDYVGLLVKQQIRAGQAITEELVVRVGQTGFLAGILKKGMRAVSIEVNKSTGVSGFIAPGDYVDVLLTHKIEGKKKEYVTELILSRVLVLALDQSVSQHKDNQARVAETVTLEVTPKQAEMIALARNLGRLSLSLQSVKSAVDDEEQNGLTRASDVSDALSGGLRSKSPENVKQIIIIRGNQSQEVTVEAQ